MCVFYLYKYMYIDVDVYMDVRMDWRWVSTDRGVLGFSWDGVRGVSDISVEEWKVDDDNGGGGDWGGKMELHAEEEGFGFVKGGWGRGTDGERDVGPVLSVRRFCRRVWSFGLEEGRKRGD